MVNHTYRLGSIWVCHKITTSPLNNMIMTLRPNTGIKDLFVLNVIVPELPNIKLVLKQNPLLIQI
jgi:hypothetical protein